MNSSEFPPQIAAGAPFPLLSCIHKAAPVRRWKGVHLCCRIGAAWRVGG